MNKMGLWFTLTLSLSGCGTMMEQSCYHRNEIGHIDNVKYTPPSYFRESDYELYYETYKRKVNGPEIYDGGQPNPR